MTMEMWSSGRRIEVHHAKPGGGRWTVTLCDGRWTVGMGSLTSWLCGDGSALRRLVRNPHSDSHHKALSDSHHDPIAFELAQLGHGIVFSDPWNLPSPPRPESALAAFLTPACLRPQGRLGGHLPSNGKQSPD